MSNQAYSRESDEKCAKIISECSLYQSCASADTDQSRLLLKNNLVHVN